MHSTERHGAIGGGIGRVWGFQLQFGIEWPAILGLSVVAAWTVTIAHVAAPFREVVLFWFLAVCPGMAVVRALRLRESVTQWTMAVSISVAIDMSLAIGQLYTDWWSPKGSLIALTMVILAGIVLDAAWPNELGGRVSITTREARASPTATSPASHWPMEGPISRRPPIAEILPDLPLLVALIVATGWVLLHLMPTVPMADLRAWLGAFVETSSGKGSAVIGIATALLLGILLIEREVEIVAGKAIPGPWAACRNVAITLLIVVFVTVIGLRVACMANPSLCPG